jgi:hypothetical protein
MNFPSDTEPSWFPRIEAFAQQQLQEAETSRLERLVAVERRPSPPVLGLARAKASKSGAQQGGAGAHAMVVVEQELEEDSEASRADEFDSEMSG